MIGMAHWKRVALFLYLSFDSLSNRGVSGWKSEDPEVKFWAQTGREDQGWCQQQLSYLTNFSKIGILCNLFISHYSLLFHLSVWLCPLCILYIAFVLKWDLHTAPLMFFTAQCGLIREIPVLFPTKVIVIK